MHHLNQINPCSRCPLPDDRAQGEEVYEPVQRPPDPLPPPPGSHHTGGVQHQLVAAPKPPDEHELEAGHAVVTPNIFLQLQEVVVASDNLESTLIVTEKILLRWQIPRDDRMHDH